MHYCGLFPVSFHTVRMPKLEYIQISGKCLSSFQTFYKPNISENRTKCPEPEGFGFQGLYCMLSGPFDLVALILSIAFDILSMEMSVEHRGSETVRSGKSGSSPVPSFSNTLDKNELRTFAFS